MGPNTMRTRLRSCVSLACSPSCPSSPIFDHESALSPLAIPRRPTTTVTFLRGLPLFSTTTPAFTVRVCAARQHEAAEIGAHPRFMYVLHIPGRPYLVQGLRSARAEGASGGGSAVAAAGVACRTIEASCTAHLMPRDASSRLHVHVSEKTSIL